MEMLFLLVKFDHFFLCFVASESHREVYATPRISSQQGVYVL